MSRNSSTNQTESALQFLADASALLSASLDYKTTLANVAHLAVPKIADWCTIYIVNDVGALEPLVAVHADPAKTRWLKTLNSRYLPDPDAQAGVSHVIHSQKPEYVSEVTDAMLVKSALNEEHLTLLRTIGLKSYLTVPLVHEGKSLGAIMLVKAGKGGRYRGVDLQIAQELASRAALAIANSKLYLSAQQAVTSRDEFISIASHEIKTPLTSIKGFVQLIRRRVKPTDSPQIYEYVDKIENQVGQLTKLITNLLDVTRIEAGKLVYSFEELDIREVIEEVCEVCQAATPTHTIIIDSHDPVAVVADRERISQVLMNLVTNAIKYSPEADQVIVRITEGINEVMIGVQDFGRGLTKEAQAKIFQRYYRVQNTDLDTLPSLGLGLYLSSQIIKAHRGKIEVKSRVNHGSTFSFTLPKVKDAL